METMDARPESGSQAVNDLVIDVAQPDAPVTTLAPTPRAVLALQSPTTEVAIAELVQKHAGLVEVKNKAGRDQVHGAAMELMRYRTSIKARADDVREDAKKFNAAVIAEEKRLTALIEPEEQRLKALRDAWDTEQERIKKEAEEKERARVLALGARIQEIRGFAKLAGECRSSDAVRRLVDRLAGLDMTGFEEFEEEAVRVFTETRQQVESTLNARLATEAEAARLKAEREELQRQQAEAKRQADELAAQQKAEADRLAAERAEFARQQQEAADKLAAQQAEIERQRGEIEAAKAPAPVAAAATCCENGPAGGVCGECADTSAAYSADMKPVRDADLVIEVKCSSEPSQHAAQIAGYEFVTGVAVRTIPDADLVDTATAEVGIGFDMAMSMPVPKSIDEAHNDAPPAASLIHCIAFEYGVEHQTAQAWLIERAAEIAAYTAPQPVGA